MTPAIQIEQGNRVVSQAVSLGLESSGTGNDRRSERRIRINQFGTLRVVRPATSDRISVRIADISPSGLGLVSLVPLPPGLLVHIRVRRSLAILGEVRYSVSVANYYYSGVRLQSSSLGTKEWWAGVSDFLPQTHRDDPSIQGED